jgi:hypothetical protein
MNIDKLEVYAPSKLEINVIVYRRKRPWDIDGIRIDEWLHG